MWEQINVDNHPVGDIESGIIQICKVQFEWETNVTLSLGHIFHQKTNASLLLFQGRQMSLPQSLKMFGYSIFHKHQLTKKKKESIEELQLNIQEIYFHNQK